MANKVAALLALCLVLVASVQLRETEATEATFPGYTSCFTSCHDECVAAGNGFTHCEMKCDADCANQENQGKIHVI